MKTKFFKTSSVLMLLFLTHLFISCEKEEVEPQASKSEILAEKIIKDGKIFRSEAAFNFLTSQSSKIQENLSMDEKSKFTQDFMNADSENDYLKLAELTQTTPEFMRSLLYDFDVFNNSQLFLKDYQNLDEKSKEEVIQYLENSTEFRDELGRQTYNIMKEFENLNSSGVTLKTDWECVPQFLKCFIIDISLSSLASTICNAVDDNTQLFQGDFTVSRCRKIISVVAFTNQLVDCINQLRKCIREGY